MSLTRRLLSRSTPRQAPRLPWLAVDETLFTDVCTRCSACLDACPEQIVVKGDGGFPEIDFSRGGCTFCGACADACAGQKLETPLFRTERTAATAFGIRVQISEICFPKQGIDCRSCGDACDAQAIHFHFNARRMAEPELDHDACTGCGACLSVCPASALTFQPRSTTGVTA